MNPHEDFCEFSVKKWQRIKSLSQRVQTLNSLLDFSNSEEIRAQPLVNDCKFITDSLKADFEHTIDALVQLIEVEDAIK